MKPFEELMNEIEFKASADYDMKIVPNIEQSINRLKEIGAPNSVIEMFKQMFREAFIQGAKEGCLLTIQIAVNDE